MSDVIPAVADADGAEAIRQKYLEARPMWKIVLGQFLEHRMAVAGLFVIAFFLLVALLAPVIAAVTGLEPDRQNVLARYLPMASWEDASTYQREIRVDRFLRAGDRSAFEEYVSSLGLVDAGVAREDVLYELVARHEPA